MARLGTARLALLAGSIALVVALIVWLDDERTPGAAAPPAVVATPGPEPGALPATGDEDLARLSEAPAARTPAALVPTAEDTGSASVLLSGRVVDEAAAPVVGARVHVVAEPPAMPADVGFGIREADSWSNALDDWWRPDLRLEHVAPPRRLDLAAVDRVASAHATTAGDGRFGFDAELPAREAGNRPFLLVLHPDFAPAFARLGDEQLGTGELDDVVMQVGVAVGGRVVDAGGRPVVGAVVRLGREWGFAVAQTQVSGATGAFTFAHVSPGSKELRIEHADFMTLLRGHQDFEEDSDLGDVTLHAGGALSGLVLGADGLPVERAHVLATTEPIDGREMHPVKVEFEPDEDSILLELEVAAMPQTGHAVTDARGRFRIDGLRHANHTVYARHPGHEPVRRADVVPGAGLELRLGPRRDQLVRVTDEQRRPVPDLELRAWRLLGRSGGRRIPVVPVDVPSGLYRLEGLGSRDTYVTARAPGRADAEWTATPEELAGREPWELTVGAGYAIEAEVVDEQGERLERWNLSVSEAAGGRMTRLPGSRDTGPQHRFEGLPAGEYEVQAWPGMFNRGLLRPEPVVVSLGPESPAVTCRLVARSGAILEGAVASPDPEPRWFSVRLAPPGEQPTFASPQARRNQFAPARYRLSPAPPGEWSVFVDGRLAGTVTLVAGETTTLDVSVPAQARIEGVVTADGAPAAGAQVRARYVGSRGASTVTAHADADGRYTAPVTLTGAWEVGATGPAASKYEKPLAVTRVEVPEHGVAVCDLTLSVGRVRLRVVREDGQPAAGRSVWLVRDTEGSVGARRTDDEGRVAFEHVPPGRWRARLHRYQVWTDALGEWFEVGADGRVVEAPDVLLPRGHAVHGTAFVAPGVPVPAESHVRLWSVTNDEWLDSTELDGPGFRFEGLAPGDYRVALFRSFERMIDEGNGHLGTLVTLVDADVEVELVGAVDDAP